MDSPIQQLKEAGRRLDELEQRSKAQGKDDFLFTAMVKKFHREMHQLEEQSIESARLCAKHQRQNKNLASDNSEPDHHSSLHKAQCAANMAKIQQFCKEVDEFREQAKELERLENAVKLHMEMERADARAIESKGSDGNASKSRSGSTASPAVMSLQRILDSTPSSRRLRK